MALGAKAANVAVLVQTTVGQRHDVVWHCRLPDNPLGGAIAAKWLYPQSTNALGDTRSTSETPYANAPNYD